MSVYETVGSLDASGLAWVADRLSLLALEPEHRRWFENLADQLEEIIARDIAIHKGCHASGYCDAEQLLDAIGEHVAIDVEHDGSEQIGEAVAKALADARSEGHKDALVPSRQDSTSKGKRLLLEARINVERIVSEGELAGLIVASCRGDSGEVYKLGYDPRRRGWRCTCPEMRGNCSHLQALKLITTLNVPSTQRRPTCKPFM